MGYFLLKIKSIISMNSNFSQLRLKEITENLYNYDNALKILNSSFGESDNEFRDFTNSITYIGTGLKLFNSEINSFIGLLDKGIKILSNSSKSEYNNIEKKLASGDGEIAKDNPRLTAEMRISYENMLKNLDEVASKKIVNFFLDAGIIVADIFTKGKTGTILSAAKDQFKINTSGKPNFNIPESSIREANENLSLADRNQLIKEAIDIYIDSELNGDGSALSNIPQYAAGEIISHISQSVGAAITLFDDAYNLNKIRELQEKINVELRLDDLAKNKKPENVTQQDLENHGMH